MTNAERRARKPFADRALTTYTKSRRWRAGSRKNKRRRDVGSFGSDRKQVSS